MTSERRMHQARIDYLTVTSENFATKAVLTEIAHIEQRKHVADAGRVKPLHFHGYAGWRCPRVGYAENEAGKLHFSLYGEAAHDWADALFGQVDIDVKRLDLCVTVALDNPRNLAKLAYAERLGPRSAGVLRNGKRVLIVGDDGGSTCYIGKRGAERFARLYDKGVQSGADAPGVLWRFEVELRRGVADKVWQTVKYELRKHDWISAYVFDHFRKRGITPPFERGVSSVVVERYIKVSNAETRLEWLSRSVAPVVTQLLLAGFSEDVYNSLGLPNRSSNTQRKV